MVHKGDVARPSVDARTRPVGPPAPVDVTTFWAVEWRDALARHGERAGADAARLGLAPLSIAVDGDAWTIRESRQMLAGRPRTPGDGAGGLAGP